MNRYRKIRGSGPLGLCLLLLNVQGLFAQAEKPVVAVVPFSNTSANTAYSYLSGSLADAVNTSIVRLKRFELVERSEVSQTSKSLNLNANILTKSQTAELANELDADYFIMGNFIAIGKQIQINARIIRTKDKADLSGAKVNGAIDNNIFQTIDTLADALANNLDKAVPLAKERVKLVSNPGQVIVLPMSYLPLTSLADSFGLGYGGAIEIGWDNLLAKNFYTGLRSGFVNHAADQSGIDSLTVIPVMANVGYNLIFSSRLYIRPFVGGGLHMGQYRSSRSKKNYRLGAAGAGIQAGFFAFRNFNIVLNVEANMQLGSEQHIYLVTGLGMTWHLF